MNEPLSALELFRAGHDTVSISQILRMSEAMALEALTLQRCASLGLSDPYLSASKPVAKPSKSATPPRGKRKTGRVPLFPMRLRCSV